MIRLTRDGTAEPVSLDQIVRRERGQGNIHFSCSADHELDWQPYPVDPYFCYMCDHTYILYLVLEKQQRVGTRRRVAQKLGPPAGAILSQTQVFGDG